MKQYRTIEQMCSDAHSITLNSITQSIYKCRKYFKPFRTLFIIDI